MAHYIHAGRILCGRHQEMLDRQRSGEHPPPGQQDDVFSPWPMPGMREPRCRDCQKELGALQRHR